MVHARPGCLFLSPGNPSSDEPGALGRFAEALVDRRSVVRGLEVWRLPADAPYDLATEVEAAARTAAEHGMARFHLVGFSAGATVALATALWMPALVATIAVMEPASIGDDEWDPVETSWRRDLASVQALPPSQRSAAFRRLTMRAGEPVPPPRSTPRPWDDRTDRLEDMLATVGFGSADLARIDRPTLVVAGGRSSQRFTKLAERMVAVMPRAEAAFFPDCSHVAPPHHLEPDRLADVLSRLWALA